MRLSNLMRALEDAPEKVNSDAYGRRLDMIKMKINDTSEIDSLLDAQGYKEVIGG